MIKAVQLIIAAILLLPCSSFADTQTSSQLPAPTISISPQRSSQQPAPPPPVLRKMEVGDGRGRIEWTGSGIAYNLYLKNSDGSYQRLNSKPILKGEVDLVDLTNGTPYRFAITAINKNGKESKTAETGMMVPIGYGHRILNMKGGSSAADYQLFATPYALDKSSPEDVFSYFPTYNLNQWRLFSLEGDGYKEYGNIDSIKPGKGYWILSRSGKKLFLSGKTANVYNPQHIQLHSGWNIIGSPFMFPVRWQDAILHNPRLASLIGDTLWAFKNGGFQKAETVQPFVGYYVYNGSNKDVSLLFPPIPASPRLSTELAPLPGPLLSRFSISQTSGWSVQISATDGKYTDKNNLFGIQQRLSKAEQLGAEEPPAWAQHLSLYFVQPSGGKRLWKDIRQEATEWVAKLEGGEADKVTLSWKLNHAPPLTILDRATGKSMTMADKGSYTFRRQSRKAREFIISLKK